MDLLLEGTAPEREAAEGVDAAPCFTLPEEERDAVLPDLVALPLRLALLLLVAEELPLLALEELERDAVDPERVAEELLMVPPFARVPLWELVELLRVALELRLALELLRWPELLLTEPLLRLALLELRLAELLRLALELLELRLALELLRLAEELLDERVEDDLEEELLLRDAPPLRVCASAVPSVSAATIAAAKTVLSTFFITLIVLV